MMEWQCTLKRKHKQTRSELCSSVGVFVVQHTHFTLTIKNLKVKCQYYKAVLLKTSFMK
jgi:hypothetical protein